jgi:hypothetical protein
VCLYIYRTISLEPAIEYLIFYDRPQSILSLYIYIYMCVCVCVGQCNFTSDFREHSLQPIGAGYPFLVVVVVVTLYFGKIITKQIERKKLRAKF